MTQKVTPVQLCTISIASVCAICGHFFDVTVCQTSTFAVLVKINPTAVQVHNYSLALYLWIATKREGEKSSCAFTLTAVLFCWNLPRSLQQKKTSIHQHTLRHLLCCASPAAAGPAEELSSGCDSSRRFIPSLPWETSATKENITSPLLFLGFLLSVATKPLALELFSSSHPYSSLIYYETHTHTLEAV